MSAEKFRVVIYTNTCEKKVICIPATEDINIAIMPFQTADNALIIVCQNTRIIRRTERIPGSCSEWKEVGLSGEGLTALTRPLVMPAPEKVPDVSEPVTTPDNSEPQQV